MRMARPGPAGGTVAAKGFLFLLIQFTAISMLMLSCMMRKLVVNAANLPVQSDMNNSNEPNINDPPPPPSPMDRMERLNIPKDQTLLVRLPSNTLLKYNSYKDVSILHFRVPDDTRTAMFSFKASEESKSAFLRKCRPRDVSLHLKAGSYPVISPENITFPRNFLSMEQRSKMYSLQFQSNEIQQRITVTGPQVGNWFAVVFVSWTDPNNDRIEQQGLAASCDTMLLAEMSVSRFQPIIINNGQVYNSTLTTNSNRVGQIPVEGSLSPDGPDDRPNIHHLDQEMENRNNRKNVTYTTRFKNVQTRTTNERIPKSRATTTFSSLFPPGTSSSLTDLESSSSSFSSPKDSNSNTKQKKKKQNSGDQYKLSCDQQSTTNQSPSPEIEKNNEIIFKFYVPANVGVATVHIKFAKVCLYCPDVSFHVQANAFPNVKREQQLVSGAVKGHDNNYVHSTLIRPNQTGAISVDFYVQPNSWHYAQLQFVNNSGHYNNNNNNNNNRNDDIQVDVSKFANNLTLNSNRNVSGTYTTSEPIESDSSEQDNSKDNQMQRKSVKKVIVFNMSSEFNNDEEELDSDCDSIWIHRLPFAFQIDFRGTQSINDNRKTLHHNQYHHHHYHYQTTRVNREESQTQFQQNIDNKLRNEQLTVTATGLNPTKVTSTSTSTSNSTLTSSLESPTLSLPLIMKQGFSPLSAENHKSNTKSKEDSSSGDEEATRLPESNPWQPYRFRDIEFYPLLRQTYREFFMFDYDLVPDENGTVPAVLNLTAGRPAGFAFEVGDVYDIGGTLSFAISMKLGDKGGGDADAIKSTPSLPSAANERSGILAEKLIGGPINIETRTPPQATNTNTKTLPRSNQTIIVCMHLGEPGEPTWPDKCRYGRRLLPASSIVNNTDANTSTGLVHVPFPEGGQWYVTMGLYCHGAETASRITIIDSVKEFIKKYAAMLSSMRLPCACGTNSSSSTSSSSSSSTDRTSQSSTSTSYRNCVRDQKCLDTLNETETLKIKECLMDSKCTLNHLEMTRKFEVHHKFATEQHFAVENCSTSVVFTISSSPCVAGRCGRFGRCYHYMSGGFVFSTCVCLKGYRGWDCTEDTQVPSNMSIILASLLLTLSNLLFMPSIYLATKRRYYTEAVIYFFAMFFSVFYHACDSGEDEYSFCLVKIGVLQFCDFYCGLLAIWVTLVAMSHIRQQFISILHMLGAILLAFGTELNKQSLWVFLAPALTGICMISASWSLRCYKTRKCFPARNYLILYMPMGSVLVMVGLICYAFLQTKQNYYIVHSIWHMVMALSILCLLPSRKSFSTKC